MRVQCVAVRLVHRSYQLILPLPHEVHLCMHFRYAYRMRVPVPVAAALRPRLSLCQCQWQLRARAGPHVSLRVSLSLWRLRPGVSQAPSAGETVICQNLFQGGAGPSSLSLSPLLLAATFLRHLAAMRLPKTLFRMPVLRMRVLH